MWDFNSYALTHDCDSIKKCMDPDQTSGNKYLGDRSGFNAFVIRTIVVSSKTELIGQVVIMELQTIFALG